MVTSVENRNGTNKLQSLNVDLLFRSVKLKIKASLFDVCVTYPTAVLLEGKKKYIYHDKFQQI